MKVFFCCKIFFLVPRTQCCDCDQQWKVKVVFGFNFISVFPGLLLTTHCLISNNVPSLYRATLAHPDVIPEQKLGKGFPFSFHISFNTKPFVFVCAANL